MKEIYARDYGIFPNSTEDTTEKFIRMFAENKTDTKFILDQGVYHFSTDYSVKKYYPMSNTDDIPERSISFEFPDMHNIFFEGNGSVFELIGTTVPLSIVDSSDITVKSLSFDWKIPLAGEGIIIAANKEYMDIKIDEDIPYVVEDEWLWFLGENWKEKYYHFCEFDRVTKKIAYTSGDSVGNKRFQDLGNHTIRFWGKYTRIPVVGNIAMLRHGIRCNPGGFVYGCKNVVLDDLVFHGTGGLGVLAQFNENLTFTRIRFEPSKRHNRRVVTGHDDGFHLSNNKGKFVMDSCWFYGLADDPVNVHGTSIRVAEVTDDHTLLCEFGHRQSINLDRWAASGDEIAFFNNEAMSYVGCGVLTGYEQLTPTRMRLTFRDSIPEEVRAKFMLENITYTPSVEIRNCYFGSCRARGILIASRKPILVENNVFESAGTAVMISGDGNNWFESGAVRDVVIRNNFFGDACSTSEYGFCDAVIVIRPDIPHPEKGKYFHENIRIENNTIHAFDYPVLYAFSAKGVRFTGNNIIRSNMYEPYHEIKNMVTLNYCSDVKITGNRCIGDVLGQDIVYSNMDREELEAQEDFTVSEVSR